MIVVCSELRILLLCGSDLLESFCIPGLWNESDVSYDSFLLKHKCIYIKNILAHILFVQLKLISRARMSAISGAIELLFNGSISKRIRHNFCVIYFAPPLK